MKNDPWLSMVLGCILPLLFLFLVPASGIGNSSSLFLFLFFMYAYQRFIPHRSRQHSTHNLALYNQDNWQNNFEDPFKKNVRRT